jgi:integrase
MAKGWIVKIEGCRCAECCGWKATRQRPTKCPSCSTEERPVAVELADGRWRRYRATYRDPSERARSRTFEKRTDADAFLAKVTVTLNEGSFRDPDAGKEHFGPFLMQRIETSPKLGRSTRRLYEIEARKYILPALEHVRIATITPTMLQDFVDRLQRERVGDRTVQIVAHLISGTLAKAVRLGVIPSNPAHGVELPTASRRPLRLLRPDEVERIAETVGDRYRALILVAAWGSLRFGEAAGLRLRDLDLLRRRFTVAGAVVQVGSDVRRVDETKTDTGLRTVTVPSFVVEELAAHLARFEVRDPDALIFTSPKGGPLSRTLFRNRQWLPALQKLDIGEWVLGGDGVRRFKPGVRFHDLRHFGIAASIAVGAHPKEIQVRAGHRSIKTSMDVYGALWDESQVDLADRLDTFHARATEEADRSSEVVSLRR